MRFCQLLLHPIALAPVAFLLVPGPAHHVYTDKVAVGVEIWVLPFGLKRVIRAATILTEWTLAGTDHFMTARALTKLCWLVPGDKGGGVHLGRQLLLCPSPKLRLCSNFVDDGAAKRFHIGAHPIPG